MVVSGSGDKAGATQADHGVISRPSLGLLEPACGYFLHAAHYFFFFYVCLQVVNPSLLLLLLFALRICVYHIVAE